MPPQSSPPKVIGIVGSRRRDTQEDFELCHAAFNKIFNRGDRIVSGGCPLGGDKLAEIIAELVRCTITIHYAWWDGPHKHLAGVVRNTDIANDCDVLIALPAEDRKGGTEDTIRKDRLLGKEVILV